MTTYHWILTSAFCICLSSCLFQSFQILLSRKTPDYAAPRGNVRAAICYAFSGAMSPINKETATFHWPSYAAGVLYHGGTLVSFLWLTLHFFQIKTNLILVYNSVAYLALSTLCGALILFKRIINSDMRQLSIPDDYFSNLLVTGFQALSGFTLITGVSPGYLFIWATVLLLYLPLGKLRHSVYFFTSRIELGLFYGKRNVWPPKRQKL